MVGDFICAKLTKTAVINELINQHFAGNVLKVLTKWFGG